MGNSEEEIKQAFGGEFRLDTYEGMGHYHLIYEDEGDQKHILHPWNWDITDLMH